MCSACPCCLLELERTRSKPVSVSVSILVLVLVLVLVRPVPPRTTCRLGRSASAKKKGKSNEKKPKIKWVGSIGLLVLLGPIIRVTRGQGRGGGCCEWHVIKQIQSPPSAACVLPKTKRPIDFYCQCWDPFRVCVCLWLCFSVLATICSLLW